VFEAFGQVELVQLPLDETGHCKGFGFVQVSNTIKTYNDILKLPENAPPQIAKQHMICILN
jgi:hypothetical protein